MNTISSQNPFFETYSTLHGTVPFDKIKTGNYVPAVREGIRRQNAEIDAIIRNPEVPTFANTVLAYEKSGEMLHRVSTVFGNLLSAETDDDLQELAKEIMPMMSEHENNISLNEELFARIKAVYKQQDKETLNPEQHKLLEDIYNGFVRNGANLQGEAKEKYRALCKELSLLTLQFSENNLKETNDDLQELAKEIMPMMSEHENNLSLNEELFARIKAVYKQQDKETLNPEQNKLL